MDMVVRGKRDVKSVLVKIGIAVSLSFSGFIVSKLRSRSRAVASLPPPPRPPSSSAAIESEVSGTACLKEDLHILKSEEASAKFVNGNSATAVRTMRRTTATNGGLSPTSTTSDDEEAYLLPEFNNLVIKEFDDCGKEMENHANISMLKKSGIREEGLMEQKLADLKGLMLPLHEREKDLELELLEYYGEQEQEAAMRELENQLKINRVETKFYSLKIESLQVDNRRLQAQLVDYSRAMNELEVARSEIDILKKKIKADSEQTKEKLAALQSKINMMQSREQKDAKDKLELEKKLKRMNELDDEVSTIKVQNLNLSYENAALARQLESMKHPSSSCGPKEEILQEEANQLREENEKLKKEFEQLHSNWYADVEELVYLRWVNSCLRYELRRNYQVPPGETVARDISKVSSPKSEEKAKQLILQYANSGANEKITNLNDFESECSSSSQALNGEPEDFEGYATSSTRTRYRKKTFLKRLKKIVLGKGLRANKISSIDRTPTSGGSSEISVSVSSCSMDDLSGRDSYRSYSSCITEDLGPEADEQNKVARSSTSARHLFGITKTK